jgi:hypothetical protein
MNADSATARARQIVIVLNWLPTLRARLAH